MKNMTAKVSCFARAYHSRMNQIRVFSDEAAYLLLGEEYDQIAENMMKGASFFLPDFKGSPKDALRLTADRQLCPPVLARSAFCEDMLKKSVQKGCSQYLLAAAGYDTFGIRNQDQSLTVFEVDLPDILADKEDRIRSAGLQTSSVFVPCDLSDPSWTDRLQENGFDRKKTAFVGMLGISYYLCREDFRKLIMSLGGLLKEGSGICFDYPSDEESRESRITQELAREAGETMKAKYTVSEIKALLEENGFEIKEHLLPGEMTERYFSFYNHAVPKHSIEAPTGVHYVCAVKRKDEAES